MLTRFKKLAAVFDISRWGMPNSHSQDNCPPSFTPSERRDWASLKNEQFSASTDDYLNAMALSYACATGRTDSVQFLLEKLNTPANGYFGVSDAPIYATVDYNEFSATQLEIAKLLKKHGVDFNTRDMDKHSHGITNALWDYMYPSARDNDGEMIYDTSDVPDYLSNSPLKNMEASEIYAHVMTLALSYAMLKEMPVEAEFLIREKRASVYGTDLMPDEPFRAVIRGESEKMKVILSSHDRVAKFGIMPATWQPS